MKTNPGEQREIRDNDRFDENSVETERGMFDLEVEPFTQSSLAAAIKVGWELPTQRPEPQQTQQHSSERNRPCRREIIWEPPVDTPNN